MQLLMIHLEHPPVSLVELTGGVFCNLHRRLLRFGYAWHG
jgi:hypothetical protein